MAEFDSPWKDLNQQLPDYQGADDERLNESYRGVSRKFYPDLPLWPAIDKLKSLPTFPGCLKDDANIQILVRDFYKQRFWDRLQSTEISDQKIAEALFMTAVSIGLRRTIRLLQSSLNLVNDNINEVQELLVTGSLDQETWLALQSQLKRVSTSLMLLETFKVRKTVFDYELASLQRLPTVGMQRGRVFISYARKEKDIAVAEHFSKLLKNEGWSVWWDVLMKAGVDLERRIERELKTAHCVVVLWSTNSKKSNWVCKEAGLARDSGKLLPIFIEDVEAPTEFKNILGIKFLSLSGEDYERAKRSMFDKMNKLAIIGLENTH